MKSVIKKVIVFLLSIIIIDILLGLFLDKDIKNFSKYNFKSLETSKMGIVDSIEKTKQLGIKNIDGYPYWEMEYRGPYTSYKIKKQLNCRVLGIGGSIIWGAGVEGDKTYLYKMSEKISNTEFINSSIPGSMPLQQIIKLKKDGLLNETNLLFWSIWHDDFIAFTYSNGLLYNSKIELNNLGNISLFKNIPNSLNQYLINNSLLYNKILRIKINIEMGKKGPQDITEKYILEKVKIQVDEYLKLDKNNKVVFLFPTYLKQTNNSVETIQHTYMLNSFKKVLKDNKRVSFIDFSDLLGKDFEKYNLDDVHLNEEGHQFVAQKLLEYIKTNKLLDEKCY